MAERKRRGKQPQSAEIANLFKVLKAMAADPAVKDSDFRVAFRVAQQVDEMTGWAEIGDARLVDETCANGQKVRRARRSLEASGWIHTVEGKRGRATRYLFLEQNVSAIEARLKEAEEEREAAFALEQIKRRTADAAEAMGVKIHRETGEVLGSIGREISPPKASPIPYKTGVLSPSPVTPLLPESSTHPLPVKDVSQDMRITCTECERPAVVRCGLVGEAYCETHRWLATRETALE